MVSGVSPSQMFNKVTTLKYTVRFKARLDCWIELTIHLPPPPRLSGFSCTISYR